MTGLAGWLAEALGGAAPGPGARAVLAAGGAAATVVLGGPAAIRTLRRRRAAERVAKGDAPGLDALLSGKAGTPTCGGFLVLAAAAAATLVFADVTAPAVLGCLALTTVCAALGWGDDRAKLAGRVKGLSIRFRLAAQAATAVALALLLTPSLAGPDGRVPLLLPGLGAIGLPLVAFAGLACLTVAGSVNAVNVTDGLDGLAPGLVALTATGCAVAAAAVGLPGPAAWLGTAPLPHAGEVAVFAAAVAGACAGFLWHNCHPARVFLGNVGAAGLGGALGAVAVTARVEAVLVLAGAVLVAEAGSVLLQIASFRLFGRRLFRIAPLHHRFQFVGWHETAVTTRFWLVGVAALAVAAAIWPLPR